MSSFATLTAGLLVRKGAAKPSPIMTSETFPFAQRAAPAPVDAPIPVVPRRHSERHELPPPSAIENASATPRRMFLQLSAKEYETLGLVAVKKGITPQRLLRKVVLEFVAAFAEQCDGSCHCIRLNRENFSSDSTIAFAGHSVSPKCGQ